MLLVTLQAVGKNTVLSSLEEDCCNPLSLKVRLGYQSLVRLWAVLVTSTAETCRFCHKNTDSFGKMANWVSLYGWFVFFQRLTCSLGSHMFSKTRVWRCCLFFHFWDLVNLCYTQTGGSFDVHRSLARRLWVQVWHHRGGHGPRLNKAGEAKEEHSVLVFPCGKGTDVQIFCGVRRLAVARIWQKRFALYF